MTRQLLRAVPLLLAISIGFALLLLPSCGGPQGSTHSGQTCTFPTVLEQTPGGGDQLLLCGNGDVLECRDGSCAIANGTASSGSPNSGNPNNSNQGNPVDSNNRTIVNPTPTPERGLGR